MNILIYCSGNESKIDILLGAVRRANGSPVLKLCHELNHVFEVLRDHGTVWDAVVAQVASVEDLQALQQLDAMAIGPHLILVLPDQDKETINQAICLQPSYFTTFNSDLASVTMVLSHLAEKAQLRA